MQMDVYLKEILHTKKTTAKEYSISFSTYEELLNYINNVFIEDKLTNTRYKLSKRHKGKDGDCKILRITGNNIVYNILNKIYETSEDLRLERKYNKYIAMLQYIQEKGDR